LSASTSGSWWKPFGLRTCNRSLNIAASRLNGILCHREQRHVSEQLSLAYDRKQIILDRGEVADVLGGKYVDLYHYPDGRLEVRWKGVSLPYRVFSKDRRVSHTAVVENKRLGHALSLISAQQQVKREPKVQTNSEKLGYKKHPRKVYGPDYEEPMRWSAGLEMCQWIRETLDKESVWDVERSTSLSR
jgi:hypothetical protein